MDISVGMFGFGKTGCFVAEEIIKDDVCDLKWVVRKSSRHAGDFASRLLGYEQDKGQIFCLDDLDSRFFQTHKVDVIIDFSSGSAVEEYSRAAQCGTRIVSAISKYEKAQLNLLRELGKQTAVLYSPNITLGVNFLIEVSKVLQRIVPDADIEIIEEHFRGKRDVSGTALRIAEDLGLSREQHVNSIRVGGVVGKHEVVFGLPHQTIRLTHNSISRAAFGQGAIFAAKWLMRKRKGIYTMEEAVKLCFARNPNVFELDAS